MTRIEVKSYPASNGEGFLVSLHGNNATNILIDSGYGTTADCIINDLKKLAKVNEKLDLMVLTHIDNDHINGARKILKEISNNNIIEMEEIWYNDFLKMKAIDQMVFGEMKEDNEYIKKLLNIPYPQEVALHRRRQVGIESAQYVVQYLVGGELTPKWNKSFEGNLVCVDEGIKRIKLNEEVNIVILGPTKEILNKQVVEWEDDLRENGYIGDMSNPLEIAKAFEICGITHVKKNIRVKKKKCSENINLEQHLEYEEFDSDIVNRSSITFIVEFYEYKILFLGDSSPLEIENNLEIYKNELGVDKIYFDLVKVSHHGSKKNWSKKYMEIIDSNKYLISTNGLVHGHPDVESVCKIICSKKEKKDIYINYQPKDLMDELERVKGVKEFAYRFNVKNLNIEETNILKIELTKENEETTSE